MDAPCVGISTFGVVTHFAVGSGLNVLLCRVEEGQIVLQYKLRYLNFNVQRTHWVRHKPRRRFE